jgi:hypothetical protein
MIEPLDDVLVQLDGAFAVDEALLGKVRDHRAARVGD